MISSKIPSELKERPQWLVWRFIQKDPAKKPSKIPFYATTGKPRSGGQGNDDDRANLVDFETAMERAALADFDGVGFAFLPGDGLIGIDLDGCFNTEDAAREARARKIIDSCASFTEYSPSGNGAHIIVSGQTETFKSNELGIEVFCGSQFFTFTGQHIAGTPETVNPIAPDVLVKLRRTVKGPGAAQPAAAPAASAPAQPLSASAKVESALAMISPDCSYDDWIRVGMAIHAALGEGAMSVWDHWSSRGSKYKGGKDIESHWRSFKPGAVGEGTLFKMAMDAGWRPPVPPKPAPARRAPVQPSHVDPETGEILRDPANDNEATVFTSKPLDVFGMLPPAPVPLDVLPDAIVDYVRDQSELTGSDHGIIALSAIVSAAACITDQITLQPKRRDPTWLEQPRLWVAFVGDPSTKKSPAISKAVRHVKRLDHEMSERNAAAFSDYKWQHDSWKEAKKADKNNPPPEPQKPPTERLVVEDTTVEALTEVLKDNPRGVLVLKDELTGWFASMDAYKGGGKGASMDRAHWLEAYNGGRRVIDRVTRGTVVVPNWSACILGGVQPDMMRRVSDSMGNDGLLQRFMILVARPAIEDPDRAPDMQAIEQYRDLFDWLVALQPGTRPVQLTEEAHACRERVARLSLRLSEALDNPSLKAWFGKWTGLYCRLLLVYHVLDCFMQSVHPCTVNVSGETAAKVERLMCGTLLHHGLHFYMEVIDAHERQEQVRQLARLILAKRYDRITKRDMMQYWKAGQKDDWFKVRGIVDSLCSMGWLEPDSMAIDTDGRPRAWLVNPEVHTMFEKHAERERRRRKNQAETLRELWQARAQAV